jgi:DNA (cytosine-5)-methyltransferase 1
LQETETEYTCVDAFTGAGGLSLGLARAGFRTLLAFDNDLRSIETQRLNPSYFSHKTLLADVRDFRNGVLLEKTGLRRGELFLLSGGPPCQGFSTQRIGKDEDRRNNLVYEFMALVQETSPKYFLMENVPGIEGKRGEAILKEALRRASKAGYIIHKKRLDAEDYGVPQRRRRVFVVGEREDAGFSHFEWPQPTTPAGKRITVREAISQLPPPPEGGRDHPDIPYHRRDKLSRLNIKRLQALKQGQGRDFLPYELRVKAHRISSDVIGHRYVYGRMKWDDVAPTITARFDSFTRGKFGHPEQLRTISLKEGALLQTFPMDFRFSGSKVEIARQIGNAVPPLLAEAIGRAIIGSYERSRSVRWVDEPLHEL